MVRRFRRLIPAIIIGLAIATFGHTTAHAATSSQAITLSPASTEVSVDPGATVSKSVDIINNGSDSFNVAFSTDPYHVTVDGYDPQFTQIPGTVDASQWIKLGTTTGTVAGSKLITLNYTITVPKNTVPGGYYAVVFAATSTDDVKTGVVSHNRVGTILYITVKGDIKVGGSVTGNPLPFVHLIGAVPIATKVTNSGGTHFITHAIYTVTDFTGKQVFTATTDRYVLPQTEREISSSWTPSSVFGLFTVHRSATISGTTHALPDEKILVINPWVLAIAAFIIGLTIRIPISRAYQRYSKQRSQKK